MTRLTSVASTVRTLLLVVAAAFSATARAETAPYPMIDLGLLPNGARTIPTDLGEGGHVTGYAWTRFQDHAFLWHDYRLEDLGTLGGLYSYGADVNVRGEVAGWANVESGVPFHAFYAGPSGMLNIGIPGEHASWGVAIDDAGRVLFNSRALDGRTRAYLWHDGAATDLGTLGGPDASATAMNERGQIVGRSSDASGAGHAFIWQNGVMRALPDSADGWVEPHLINDAGLVAGQIRRPEGGAPLRGFVWNGGELIDIGTFGGNTFVSDVGPAGHVVGTSLTAGGAQRAFLWKDGVLRDLGTFGGCCSEASAVDSAGRVVGGASLPTSGGTHAFLWEEGVMTDLGVLDVPPAPYDVFQYSVALDINEAGEILGYGYPEYGDLHGILWTPRSAPELLADLASDVHDLELRIGLENALSATLEGATRLAQSGDLAAACNAAGAFRSVLAAQYEKGLTWEQADFLERRMRVIDQALRCAAH